MQMFQCGDSRINDVTFTPLERKPLYVGGVKDIERRWFLKPHPNFLTEFTKGRSVCQIFMSVNIFMKINVINSKRFILANVFC